ncbi:glycerophosphodiester phosphodiesterase [Maribacter sp. 2308TA10-17]|uniref:glycerophosphodiester phosphodiesterase n=1 Tax=Maribacter sp. 2308TA10-17 TaxID=3386276 RepID=UPI0039BCFD08
MNKPLVIGHRGAMGHETENTIASIEKAIELSVDMIEIDVFQIKSGETVVFHDDELDRLTDTEGSVEDQSYSDLQKVIVKGGHKIPTLQDVLNSIGHKVKINIELKGAGTAEHVNLIIRQYIEEKGWKLDDFLISSFRWDELKKMRALDPDIPIAVLTEKDPIDAISIASELKAEAINPNFKMLNAENNLKIQEAGFKIYVWTVNEPNDILQMKRFGVEGIITNYPERVQ